MNFSTDQEKLDSINEGLFSCVIGDVMDTMGYSHQYRPPTIHRQRDDMQIGGHV